ncbi:MAG: L-glutamate gamma-semialdehyde dehydrogenase [Armatimonadetes bacterium]|nr:L-glutamate gamma-semialdehyde dehydrogenase [Armatimonadota bacterium]
MPSQIARVPAPDNEPILAYAPGTLEKAALKQRLRDMLSQEIEIPLIIGGKEVRTGNTIPVVCPHDHGHRLAACHQAGPKEVEAAIQAAKDAWRDWSEMDWEARASVFLKAADLLSGPWRDTLNAATMLNQSKTVHQAEIDSACELIDFWRFNVHYMNRIYEEQPDSSPGVWNRVDYRPLEGFLLAITPFNFTAIGGNLPTAPAMMGNVALWKPSPYALLSNFYVMRLLQKAGLPDGVVNFIPGPVGEVVAPALRHPELAGVHFTGSTVALREIWRTLAENIEGYRGYPRVVGETGGKDFIFAHPSADVPALVTAMIRGEFEYQGQKCSAASRAYVPRSLWTEVREQLVEGVAGIRMGSPLDFRNFMGAVISPTAYAKIIGYLEEAKASPDATILCGGEGDDSVGYFIQPTVIEVANPRHRLMEEEVFGPLLAVYVYEDDEMEDALRLCDTTGPYGLTGAVFAQDRGALVRIAKALRHAAGNFYINDKPTGAVVGQQPFGGSRLSGTNDKAGSMLNLIRWTSPLTIKETFVPPTDYSYPSMAEE